MSNFDNIRRKREQFFNSENNRLLEYNTTKRKLDISSIQDRSLLLFWYCLRNIAEVKRINYNVPINDGNNELDFVIEYKNQKFVFEHTNLMPEFIKKIETVRDRLNDKYYTNGIDYLFHLYDSYIIKSKDSIDVIIENFNKNYKQMGICYDKQQNIITDIDFKKSINFQPESDNRNNTEILKMRDTKINTAILEKLNKNQTLSDCKNILIIFTFLDFYDFPFSEELDLSYIKDLKNFDAVVIVSGSIFDDFSYNLYKATNRHIFFKQKNSNDTLILDLVNNIFDERQKVRKLLS